MGDDRSLHHQHLRLSLPATAVLVPDPAPSLPPAAICFDEVAADFFERNESDRESLRSLITELSRGEIDRQTEESLLTVADKFGKGAVVRLLLGDTTSDDASDNPAEGDSQRPT